MMQNLNNNKVEIRGYVPGAIGRITELHATYYSKHWGLKLNFEAEIATELSKFLLRFDETHDGIWIAVLDGNIVGSIAIDGNNDRGARLRWFIVSPKSQGCGIGQLLMQKAIDFCIKANLSRVYLWTFAGLPQPVTSTISLDLSLMRNM